MLKMKGGIEQRNNRRFQACDGAFAALRNNTSKLGQIIDISKGGLAFRYIDIGERPKESYELDIFLSSNGFNLEKVPFRTISDFELDDKFHFSSIPMRRRGVRFGELTQIQMERVEYFIQNHTLCKV